MATPEHEASASEVRQFALVQLALTTGFLLLLFWALGKTDASVPPWWLFVVLLAPVAVAAVVAERVWLRAEPLDPAADADENRQSALTVYAGHTVRKLVVCEVPVLLAVFLSFVGGHAAWPIVIGGLPGLAVLAFEVWPSLRNVSMTATVLETSGADSGLVEEFRAW